MSDHRNDFIPPCAPCDDVRAESIVVEAYLQLPLLPRQVDGSWVAPLKKYDHCELRLVECIAAAPSQPVLRIEPLDLRTQTALESRSCEEVEDAVAAFQAMVPVAATWTQPNTLAR